jgi:hypothetical protein
MYSEISVSENIKNSYLFILSLFLKKCKVVARIKELSKLSMYLV